VRILFLTHYFPPEVNAPATRTHEHCREWAAAGHEVHVVTGIPSHPRGKPFSGYRARWYQYEIIDGIHTHRVWTYLAANRGVIRRTLNYLSFVPAAVFRAWRLGRFDVAVGTSPQFFCAVAAWGAARLRRTPWVFELRDLWPTSIAAVGAVRQSTALRMLERLELFLYREAAAVVCLTRPFMRDLAGRGIDEAKLHYVPNGSVSAFWQSGSRAQGRRDLGLADDDVLVSYVGTVGMAHDLASVVEAAAHLRKRAPRIRFLVAGDGARLEDVRAMAANRGLDNVSFAGLVPRDQLPSLLAASDVMLVTLTASEVFKTVLPSKMFEAMAAERPVVLAVDGEARDVLERSGGGVAVAPGDADALAAAIHDLAADPSRRAAMGTAGRTFVEREFDRRVWAARYLTLLDSIRTPAAAIHGPTLQPDTNRQRNDRHRGAISSGAVTAPAVNGRTVNSGAVNGGAVNSSATSSNGKQGART
jgi:glycosyltransferase involved in cell wall biosynthesis